jgi:hypothetical protein
LGLWIVLQKARWEVLLLEVIIEILQTLLKKTGIGLAI